MCGIAGFFDKNNLLAPETIKPMIDVIAHRGPDAQGWYTNGKITIGHRRLSIIDLSTNANQPMLSKSGKTAIVFNGEVYNYTEVAEKLGIKTRTTSDTEVVVEAFEQLGPQCVNLFNGMFAMAICDLPTQKLYLFRDRIGIKPLFYFYDGTTFAFASELKQIEQLPIFKASRNINKQALGLFLQLGYIPAPYTIYQNVYKFPQGAYAQFDGTHLQINNYWSIDKTQLPTITNEYEAKKELKNLLESSVQYRLIADVPYGTLLSGGIDSSLVTAVASRICTNSINTFSIGFQESKHDESVYSDSVAKHLHTHHHHLTMTEVDAMERISDMFYYYDEPYADSSALPTMLVSNLASQHVKMVLTGDGGDELFMGYGMYKWAQRLANPCVKLLCHPMAFALQFANSNCQRIAKMLDCSDNLPMHVFSQEQCLFSAKEIKKILVEPHTASINTNVTTRCNLSAAERQALFDIGFYLPDDLLVKVDRATMRYSLEARVPLLDYRIVEFASNLDKSLKIKNRQAKYLLKQVLYDYLPQQLFERPKWGFCVPLAKWLATDLKWLADKYLSRSVVESANMVDYDFVRQLLDKFYNLKIEFLYNRIWVLICLHQWWVNRYNIDA